MANTTITTSNNRMIIGDENRHRELHGQYRHSTPTMHSPRISVPRIYMGNHRLLR
jgi:hypothetical protein